MTVRLIGYWGDETDDRWPKPHDLVDYTWDRGERERVASYLDQGFVPWSTPGVATCRICGRANGSSEFTDGFYLWPEGLAHYVRDHSVRLPDEVLAHITRRVDELDSLSVDRDWWRTIRHSGPET